MGIYLDGPHREAAFTNTDGQICQMPEVDKKTIGMKAQNCGWNGADSKYQKRMYVRNQDECVVECRALAWCNYVWVDSTAGSGAGRGGWCYWYGTCTKRTGTELGKLYHKKCPKKIKMPWTSAGPCDAACNTYKSEWYGDGVCDWDTCSNCDSYYKRIGDYDVFDKGDCAGDPKDSAVCADGCLKYKKEWEGDDVCDDNCAGCKSYWTNGVFDKNDCGSFTESALAFQQGSVTASGVNVVNVFAAVGLSAMVYGAFRHYVK